MASFRGDLILRKYKAHLSNLKKSILDSQSSGVAGRFQQPVVQYDNVLIIENTQSDCLRPTIKIDHTSLRGLTKHPFNNVVRASLSGGTFYPIVDPSLPPSLYFLDQSIKYDLIILAPSVRKLALSKSSTFHSFASSLTKFLVSDGFLLIASTASLRDIPVIRNFLHNQSSPANSQLHYQLYQLRSDAAMLSSSPCSSANTFLSDSYRLLMNTLMVKDIPQLLGDFSTIPTDDKFETLSPLSTNSLSISSLLALADELSYLFTGTLYKSL